ncbi:hypothetical protein AM493_17215 [Flavobacterium akiainvivens]|uniref:DUF4374 domain-containing protein n=1 Tax=Flavobacterium akiainvivens TaxID=1202724 RepID=A0A0M8MCZ2_9FLAO|nr:hypothetical protein [Flavobacterium akiainvivens]KOS07585.1 hypothetical protein AM493_17215 [Flavobacterium akiainvivens]SFQ22185.1 hypothetical protein SAMN05444144_10223 [Flavobacterium akiainvivens]
MRKCFFRLSACGAMLAALLLGTGCSDDDNNNGSNPVNPVTDGRFITVAGAIMQDEPGDGNGGTRVYSITKENAQDPNFSVNVYANGMAVQSNRTARLQSSVDGSTLFNITYTGSNGGEFMTYNVAGGGNFTQSGTTVNISQYAGTSPRWVKLFDGDNTGVAVNVTAPQVVTGTDGAYVRTRGTATVLSLDLQNILISGYKQYEIALSAAEEAQGHHIFRLDAPTLNAAGNKLIIGTWMRKTDPATGQNASGFERLGSKSVVVDYPSLENPQVITSTVAFGDTSGYRSFNSFVGNDGNVYQATQRDTENGSYILKINQNNQYDNSYVFSLDDALGVTGSYIDAWRYAGNGIAYAVYTHEGANNQGFVARLDLNARTAQLVTAIEYDADLDFGQYQGFVVDGNQLYIAVTPVGKDGNIYVIDIPSGAVTKGAKLVNQPGNHYIGVF